MNYREFLESNENVRKTLSCNSCTFIETGYVPAALSLKFYEWDYAIMINGKIGLNNSQI